MASEKHTTTRRTALVGIAAAGALIGTPAAAHIAALPQSADRTKWERRLANLRRLEAQQETYHSQHVAPAVVAYETAQRGSAAHETAFRWVQQSESEFDRHVMRTYGAVTLLLLTPAPTVADLATKLELVAKHESHDSMDADKIIAALASDARGLSKGEA